MSEVPCSRKQQQKWVLNWIPLSQQSKCCSIQLGTAATRTHTHKHNIYFSTLQHIMHVT